MDTSTSFLGFRLPHPFIAGAAPLGFDLDTVKRLEDGGCAAIVIPSLFEMGLMGIEIPETAGSSLRSRIRDNTHHVHGTSLHVDF